MTDPCSRRAFLARGAAFAAAASVLPSLDRSVGLEAAPAYAASDNAARPAATYAAMQQHFYDPAQRRYREHKPAAPGDQSFSYLWSFEEAAKATLHMYGLADGSRYAADAQARLEEREAYWDGGVRERAYRSYPQVGDRYYDDNDWVASDLVQHHLLGSGGAVALDRARAVFEYLQTGWEHTLPNRGGLRWVDATWNGDRGTASTAGYGKLGAHLYEAMGRRARPHLDAAQKSSDWLTRYLRSPQTGLYANAMRADGAVEQSLWVYNQGVVIGMNVLLHRVTGVAGYLAEARRVADAALAYFSGNFADPYYSAAGAGIGGYPGRGIFNAIFFRNLLLLHAAQPAHVPPSGVGYLARMQRYADVAWGDYAAQGQAGVRDPATGLFKLNGGAEYSLLDQAGMAQVYAALAWPAGGYGKLA